jgi:DNA-binding CsgD family transcriptional regulator
VLLNINRGLSNGEIAARMAISINTVKVHLAKIRRKTGIRNRTHATSVCGRMQNRGY